jgi:hypothetical protein
VERYDTTRKLPQHRKRCQLVEIVVLKLSHLPGLLTLINGADVSYLVGPWKFPQFGSPSPTPVRQDFQISQAPVSMCSKNDGSFCP